MKRCMIAFVLVATLIAMVKDARAQAAPPPEGVSLAPAPAAGGSTDVVPGKRLRQAGVTLTAIGLASFTAGLVVGSLAVANLVNDDPAAQDRGNSLAVASFVALGLSTLTAVGIPMWAAGENQMKRAGAPVAIVPVISHDRVGLSLGWRF